jgi:hypothetical protein
MVERFVWCIRIRVEIVMKGQVDFGECGRRLRVGHFFKGGEVDDGALRISRTTWEKNEEAEERETRIGNRNRV